MATFVTHFVVGASVALPAVGARTFQGVVSPGALIVSCGFMAVAPDLDMIAHWLKVPYADFYGHRGFWHSPFFLSLAAPFLAVTALALRSRLALAPAAWLGLLWAVSAVTHPLLDAATNGGLGVMLLYPFSDGRFFLPWTPIRVSPLEIRWFLRSVPRIFLSELPFCAAAFLMGFAGYRLRNPR